MSKSKKRIFQVFDEMVQHDIENGTRTLSISNTLVEAKTSKQGTLVTMGADSTTIKELLTGKAIAVLLIVDRDEYTKRHI